ncbi:hypothetical protein [Bartonella sp. MM73XJBT]|nr:hypothetical protein [Bartonella sp. MM73XJBT]
MRLLNDGIGLGSYEVWRLPFRKEDILGVFYASLGDVQCVVTRSERY